MRANRRASPAPGFSTFVEKSLSQFSPRGYGMVTGPSHLLLGATAERQFQYVPRPAAAIRLAQTHSLERGGLVNSRHPALIATAVVLGIAFVALGIVYWAVPAGSL